MDKKWWTLTVVCALGTGLHLLIGTAGSFTAATAAGPAIVGGVGALLSIRSKDFVGPPPSPQSSAQPAHAG